MDELRIANERKADYEQDIENLKQELEACQNDSENQCHGEFEVFLNTNCPGNDLGNSIGLGGRDHEVCASKCKETQGCVGYTWHGRSAEWSTCWLKQAVENCRPVAAGSCSAGTCHSAAISDKCIDKDDG